MNCMQKKKSSSLEEAWDKANSPEQFDSRQLSYAQLSTAPYLSGQTVKKPWSDTYWPLDAAGFADRWIDDSVAPKFDLVTSYERNIFEDFVSSADAHLKKAIDQAKQNINKPFDATVAVSGAEKIDLVLGRGEFDFLNSELISFVSNAKRFKDISWGWMGHCHGWAPASFLYDAPLNGVLLKGANGQQVFFTPGDIRGVLTKAAADRSFDGEEQFLGTRCDQSRDKTPKDSLGRFIDGTLGVAPNEDGVMADNIPIRIELSSFYNDTELPSSTASLTFRIGPDYKNNSTLYWLDYAGVHADSRVTYAPRIFTTQITDEGAIARDMIIYSDHADHIGVKFDKRGEVLRQNGQVVRNEAEAKKVWEAMMAKAPESLKTTRALGFKYWKQCRDLNPGTFHLVLASLLSKGGREGKPPRGFVLDISRDDQVWNHPIYEYTSVMGTPTDLKMEDAEDPYLDWRAKGTVKIVDVYTSMVYGVENGPNIVYDEGDDALSKKVYRYTLELDKDDRVVGGEWHYKDESGAPKSGKDLLLSLAASSEREKHSFVESPDFVWGHKLGAKLNDSPFIPKAFLTTLYDCSMKNTDLKKFTVSGVDVPYVECSL